MKKFLFTVLIFLLFFSITYAEVSRFVFITPEQSVDVNVVSKAITIQSQNSAGASEAVTETTDLEFKTTSTTGKFVASSGKTASKTMSKNTAKRSFYYVDTTPGSYTLTIQTTGRTSKKSFTISQKIVVGKQASVAPTSAPIPVPLKAPINTQSKKTEEVKSLPLPMSEQTASSTSKVKESSGFATVIYTAPPKASALDSFLWLPNKIWTVIKSVFQ